MDPLAELQQWPKEPTLKDIERRDEENDRFRQEQELATPEATQRLKEEVQKSLYWSFSASKEEEPIPKPEEETNPEEEQYTMVANVESSDNKSEIHEIEQEEISEELIKDNPLYPVLSWLLEQWYIASDKYVEIKEKMQNSEKGESEQLIVDLIDNNISDSKLRESLKKQIFTPEQISEDSFEKTEFAKHKDLLGLDISIWWLELLLAENYLSIPDSDWNENIEQNLANTIDITLNKILEKNTSDFKDQNALLIWQIRNSSSLEERYNKLKEVYREDLKTDAVAWWRKLREEGGRKRDGLKKEAKKLSEQIELATTEWRKEDLVELEAQKKKIIAEANEIDGFEEEVEWEIFAWIEEFETNNIVSPWLKENT